MIDRRELYELLKSKGIEHLQHANSVATSITFLENGGLLSRGAVRDRGLHQTSQQSDRLDKIFNVWNDLFLDMYDLHGKFPRQNYYGPVLFKISIDFLLRTKYEIRITKSNPVDWQVGERKSKRYFKNVEELNRTWHAYEHQKRMITLRDNRHPALFKYLEQIILDHPGESHLHKQLFKTALRKLRRISRSTNLDVPVNRCSCGHCFCVDNYAKYHENRLLKMFSPSGG